MEIDKNSYEITEYKNQPKSFLLDIIPLPDYINGRSETYEFVCELNHVFYTVQEIFKHEFTCRQLLGRLRKYQCFHDSDPIDFPKFTIIEIFKYISKHFTMQFYDFTIGYKKEIKKYLAKHPISGKMTEWKDEKEYNKINEKYIESCFEEALTLQKRLIKLEPIIAKSAEFSYRYAKCVIKGRFPLGEPMIAKSIRYSYEYALDVIKGRFELGEPEIKKHIILTCIIM